MTANTPSTLPSPAPEPFGSIIGIDAAVFQGALPVDALIEKSVSYFIQKAVHGASVKPDSAFEANWALLEEKRVPGQVYRTFYGWLTPFSKPEDQIKRWCEEVIPRGYDNQDLPPMIDFEDKGFASMGPTVALHWIERAISAVKEEFGRIPWVYTGSWFWQTYVGNFDSELVASCPLAYAQYPRVWKGQPQDYVNAIRSLPPHARVPFPWSSRGIEPCDWQFDGSKGLYLPNGVDADFNLLRQGLTLSQLVTDSIL